MMEILRPLFVCKLRIVGASVFGEGKGGLANKKFVVGQFISLRVLGIFLGVDWVGVSGQAN